MLSPRAYQTATTADSWEWLWEAGPYFARLAELLENARQHVVFVGWQVDSRVPLRPGHPFKETLLRLVESNPDLSIYFLIWDHAYIYVLERERMQGRVWDEIHPRIHFVFDNRHPLGASHHEKIVLIDGKTALCGGIDVCDERWDTPGHRYSDCRRSLNGHQESHGPYHDIAVQVTGPVCAALAHHVAQRWSQITDRPFPLPPAPRRLSLVGGTRAGPASRKVYLSRTQVELEEPMVREVEFLFRDLIDQAERRIILEGQYYWSEQINRLLIQKMRERARARKPGAPAFQIFLTLADLRKTQSLTRWMSAYELKLLSVLQDAARETGTDLRLRNPLSLHPEGKLPPRPVYVHSKVVVVDDRLVSIGSANLADRALRVDTELNLTWAAESEDERAQIAKLAEELEHHWTAPTVRLREVDARMDLGEYRRQHPILARLPFHHFFDPEYPWLYPARNWFRSMQRAHPLVTTSVLGSVWFAGVLLTFALAGLSAQSSAWAFALATLTASCWLIPVPLFVAAALASLIVGMDSAVRISVSGLWISALLGYFWARTFPRTAKEFFEECGLGIPGGFRSRLFRDAALTVLNPRICVRAKIIGQGLASTYFPWFGLLTLLVLPGALSLFVRLFHFAAGSIIGPEWANFLLVSSWLAYLIRETWQLHENRRRPFLQHS